jgi:hypothetical protein
MELDREKRKYTREKRGEIKQRDREKRKKTRGQREEKGENAFLTLLIFKNNFDAIRLGKKLDCSACPKEKLVAI